MIQYVAAALLVLAIAGAGEGSSSKKKIKSGTAKLKANRAYSIELQVSTPLLQSDPQSIVVAMDNGLRMAGAYDVLVEPSIPLRVQYSIILPGDLPIVLNVPAQQSIGGVAGEYTFLSVQEIAAPKRAA